MNKDNTSNAFAASLSFGFSNEDNSVYFLSPEDEKIEKYSGISVYQPTVDNIESFIRKYTMSELTGGGLEGISSLDINLILERMDTLQPAYVKDCKGVVNIKVADVTLNLPFIVIDEEFLPFDIIQLDKQRIPYSRENLRKVIFGIHQKKKNLAPIPDFDPYLKVEKHINPASSVGFLGDVLKIQEQHSFRTTSGGNMYVTAEASIDNALEKLAEMKPITEEDWKVLEGTIKEQIVKVEVDKIEKSAADLATHSDSKMAMIFNKVKDMQFLDANKLPHGTVVAFPELHHKEISMNKGIIIDDYMDIAGVMPKKIKIVVSQDCRMKVLDNRDRFLCFKIDPQGFRLHTRELDIIDKDDVFFAFDGNKAMVPCVASYISSRILKPGGEVGYTGESSLENETRKSTAYGISGVKIYSLTPIYNNTQVMSVFSDDGVDRTKSGEIFGNREDFKLVPLKGTKFVEIPYNEFIKKKAHELGITEMLAMGLAPHSSVCTSKNNKTSNIVICTDENTKIVRIKGVIKEHMRNKEDLEHMANATCREFEVMAGEWEGFEKVAGFEDIEKNHYAITPENLDNVNKNFGLKLDKATFRKMYSDIEGEPRYHLLVPRHLIDKHINKSAREELGFQKVAGPEAMTQNMDLDGNAPIGKSMAMGILATELASNRKKKAGIKAKIKGDSIQKKTAGVEEMAQTTDLGGSNLPASPMPSYWLPNMTQSQKVAFQEAEDELEKIALQLKAVADQGSKFKVLKSLKNMFEKRLQSHANRLATNDWVKLKDKGFLSPDGARVIKPFNHMGTNMKEKGLDALQNNYKQILSRDKSIGQSKFTKISSTEDDGIFKTAAANEYIELRSVDKDKGTYNLTVLHVDKTKKLFKSVHREFKAIPYQEVREILKAIGFGNIKISEIMQRARTNNYAKYELPDDATPETLSGGQVASGINSTMKKVRSTIFDSNIGDAVAAEIIGAMLAGGALAAIGSSNPLVSKLKKMAEESEALSSSFEKIAKTNNSENMLKVAKVMALASNFNEKVADVVSGKAQYFKLNDVVVDIIESKPALEKMASQLIDLKVDQFRNGRTIVNPGYIQAAVKNIDKMYNVAVAMRGA